MTLLPPLERKIVVAVAMHRRAHGTAPTWRQLSQATGAGLQEVADAAWSLRRNKMVSFTRESRSLRVTRAGLAAALGKGVHR